ncbi:MAG TPA: hypothetical protein LFV66_04110, partial [Rickettsia endosymbiont of Bembidion lapponicum]|nr:hypothetical protein [Rickettsia endosymbiont of Bembidion lapponicum]
MSKNNAYNNKDIIIKESNKNIDENLDEQNEELDENNQITSQTFLKTSNSQHLESELCSLSSKSLKNSIKDFMDALPLSSNATIEDASRTIKNISDRKNKIEKTEKSTVLHPKASNDNRNKELRHFYPLSEKDVRTLNFRSNREFSINFVNQLLLKL